MRDIRDILTDCPVRTVREDMDSRNYLALQGMNPSTLVNRKVSALAVKHAYEHPYGETDATIFGSYGHTLLFESDRAELDWAVWNGGTRRGKEWDAFKADNADRRIIKGGDGQYGAERAYAAVQAALRKPKVRELVAEGVAEVAVLTGERRMQCKGRIDWIDTRGGHMVDAKFTASIHPPDFGKSAAAFGYHIKMACYRNWFQRESGKEIKRVFLLTIQNEPPFDVALVPVEELHLEDGWVWANEFLCQVQDSLDRDFWPGVDNGFDYAPFALPEYAFHEGEVYVGQE